MDGVNNKYNIEIEVLTPLSIGAGGEKDWVRGVDFVVDNSRLYKLNLKKLVANGVKIDDLTTYFAKKDEAGIKSRIAGKIENVSDFSMQFPAETDNDIKTFVRNQLSGKPVLAGSSLKGALRSVIFDYLGGKTKDGQDVFGSAVKGDEFMRFIKVSDAEFEETELVNTKIFNLQGSGANWQGGWKKEQHKTENNFSATGFNTVYECIVPQQKGFSSIMFSENRFSNFCETYYSNEIKKLNIELDKVKDKNLNKQKSIEKQIKDLTLLSNLVEDKQNVLDLKDFFAIINKHTKEYLKKERLFFEKYSTDKTDDIIESIDNLLNQIPDDNLYCILKMSAGSGFHSITGDWQFDDYSIDGLDTSKKVSRGLSRGNKSAKSRKIAICNGVFSLMGFVKLRALSDEEVRNAEKIRVLEQQRAEAIRQAEIAAEKLRREQEIQKAKEREENLQKYKSLIEQIIKLNESEKLDEAKALCDEAASLCPDLTEHIMYRDVLAGKIRIREMEKAAAQKLVEEQQERAAKNAVPLKDKISNATRIGTLCGNVETWLKYGNKFSEDDKAAFFDKLKEISQTLKSKDLKAFKDFKSWKKTVDLFGEDVAKEWFDKLAK